jgi:hypothetical protein
VPPGVAARLEATLAGLVADRADAGQDPEPATVVSLEERRRRRWPRLLVAAAGVSVLAYGVGIAVEGLQVSGGSADSASAGKPAMERAGTDDAGGGAEAGPEDAPTGLVTDGDGVQVQGSRAYADKLIVPGTVRLHRDTLDEDVRRLVRDAVATDARTPSPGRTRTLAGFLDSCERPEVGRGDRLAAVRLDGRPGTLVLRKATDGTRVAEVYSCGDGAELWATTRVRTAP